MESQVREHQVQLRRRLESIKRIHKARDTLEDLGHVDGGLTVQLAARKPDPQAVRRLHPAHGVGRHDQRLGRHAVPQHAVAAGPLVRDQRDVRLVLGRNKRRLVAGRATADDDDPHTHLVRSRSVRSVHSRCGVHA